MGKTPRPMSPLVRVLKSEGLCEGVSAAHPRQNRGTENGNDSHASPPPQASSLPKTSRHQNVKRVEELGDWHMAKTRR